MNTSRPNKPVIGIVGGIGSGKSTVAAQFVELGCALVDADRIGHALLEKEDIRRELKIRWPDTISPDGSVNRQALGEKVFNDPRQLEQLNQLMHPRIGRVIAEQVDEAIANPQVPGVVVDAAVLLEAGWDELCTQLIFVHCPSSARAERVRTSRGWDVNAWRQRENSQISLDKKRQRCDYTVDNSSNVSHLNEQVRRIFSRSLHVSDRP